MGFLDGCAEFGAGDTGVRLEPGGALLGPVGDHAAGVFGARYLGHVGARPGAGDVGAGDVHPGADDFAGFDGAAHVDLAVRGITAGGADGGDAGRQVEARRSGVHLGMARRGRVEGVVVDAHQSGNQGVAGAVYPFRVRRDLDFAVRADGQDPLAGDDHGLSGARSRAGSVHQLRAGDRGRGAGGAHEPPGALVEFVGGLGGRGDRRDRQQRQAEGDDGEPPADGGSRGRNGREQAEGTGENHAAPRGRNRQKRRKMGKRTMLPVRRRAGAAAGAARFGAWAEAPFVRESPVRAPTSAEGNPPAPPENRR